MTSSTHAEVRAAQAEPNRVHFWCPGCDQVHGIYFGPDAATAWAWNGSLELPTIRPSVLVLGRRWEPPVTPDNHEQWEREPWEQHQVDRVCHSFVTDGRIQFLGDCTHPLAGQTVDLPPWPYSGWVVEPRD